MELKKRPLPYVGLLCTAGLLFFSMPPWPTTWLAWTGFLPLLFVASRGTKAREAFFSFWAAGFLFWLASLYWIPRTISTYGGMVPMPLALIALIALAAYMGLFTGIIGPLLLAGWRLEIPTWLTLPVGVVAGEFLRAHLLTGFPWLLLGHSQWSHPLLIQVADLTGVWGVSFAVAMVNGALFDAINAVRDRKIKPDLAIPLVLTVGVYAYGVKGLREEIPSTMERPLQVAVLQPNLGVHKKFDPALIEPNTKTNLEVFREGCNKTPDLLVFPETTLPFPLFQEAGRTPRVIDAVEHCGRPTVIGTYYWLKLSDGYYSVNRAYLLDGDGATLGWYDKVHLVPFGEYVPLRRLLPFITQVVGFKNGFTPGNSTKPLPYRKGKLGILICYESIFPEIARAEVREGAEILVNMSNDAWFGNTLAPYQHLAAAVFRAVENRRWLVRATNSGISAFVNPWGRVVKRGALFKREVLVHGVFPVQKRTLATIWGDWFAWLALILAGAIFTLMLAKREQKGED